MTTQFRRLQVGGFLIDPSPSEVAKFVLTSSDVGAFSPHEKVALVKAMEEGCSKFGRWLTGSDAGIGDDLVGRTTNTNPLQDAAARLLESTLTNPQESDAMVSELGVPWIRARLRFIASARLSFIIRNALSRV